jgi:hypothetical protein
MLILKENVADKKKRSFFKITKSVNYFWSDMKDAEVKLIYLAILVPVTRPGYPPPRRFLCEPDTLRGWLRRRSGKKQAANDQRLRDARHGPFANPKNEVGAVAWSLSPLKLQQAVGMLARIHPNEDRDQ